MTEDDTARTDRSRRSFVKHGAFASGVLALGSSLSGSALAQDGGGTDGGNRTAGGNETTDGNETADGDQDDGGDGGGPPPGDALLFNDEFRPGAQFRVVSGRVSETPELASGADEITGQYDTYIIQYLVTDERVLLFPSQDATVEQGDVYQFTDSLGVVEEEPTGEGIISVEYVPVDDEELVVAPDFSIADVETVPGGGKALVRTNNAFPGSVLRIVSGVVEWTPPPDVAGSGVLSDYNTRHAEYLNTGDDFLVYPAHAAEIEAGGVYVMREEFDVTDPEGNLVTVELDRIDEDALDDDLLEA